MLHLLMQTEFLLHKQSFIRVCLKTNAQGEYSEKPSAQQSKHELKIRDFKMDLPQQQR